MAGIAALCLGYVMSQFYRSFLAVLAPELSQELGLTADGLSFALGAWFAAFALMQFPVGVWLDRFGPRLTGGWLMAVAAIGAALFALSSSAWQIAGAMALIGIGCSAVLMAAVYLFARNYSAAGLATYSSTFIAIGTLGNILGSAPLAAAAEAMGWRAAMAGLAAITAVIAAGILFLVKDPAPADARVDQDSTRAKPEGYLALLKIRELWPVIPLVCLGYAVAAGVRGIWSGPYLKDVHGLATGEIGTITLLMAIALAAGSLIYGPMDRIFNSRKWVNLTGNLCVAAAASTFVIFEPLSVTGATLLLVLIGLSGSSYAVLLAHGRAFVPVHLTGRGVTLLNFYAIGGVGIMQFATGRIFALSGGQAAGNDAYRAIFAFYAAALFLALLVYLVSKDAKPAGVRSQ